MPSQPSTDLNWSARLLWTLVGALLLGWSFQIIDAAPTFRWAAAAALVSGGWGLGTVLVSWIPPLATSRTRDYGQIFSWCTAVIAALSFAAWAAIQVHASPAYGTDELAFDQYAGYLAQHGLNPYTHSMGRAFEMFRVSPGGYTYTLSGARVTQLSYPALSFLLYVPFLALGWSRQLGVGLDVIGWSATVLLIFAFLPRSLRPAALILGTVAAYTQLAVIGLTDMLFLPMLVTAAYRWDRFGSNWRTYLGPVMFGLAMAVKQTPWPILPFILLALILDERARSDLQTGCKRAARYLLAALLAFLIPNLPYIIAAPSAWVQGTLTPVTKSLVPAGQGAIGLSLFLHLGGGSLTAYSLLMALVLVLLLVAFCGTYPLLRATTFALPAVVYFFGVRSYAAYLVALIPPALVAAVSADLHPLGVIDRLFPSRRWLVATAAAAGLCVLAAVYAVTSTSPLSLTVTRVDAVGSDNIAEQMYVRVTNHSGSDARPGFTIITDTGVSSFWHVLHGPTVLRPGATATYLLGSPDTQSQFSVDNGITMVAFLQHPKSVSVAPRYTVSLWHAGFNPESFDNLIPVGATVVVHTQLLNRWNQPIAEAGVPVRLTQTGATHAPLATVNGLPPGAPAVVATNAQGIATFRVVGTGTSLYPDVLTASLPSGSRYHRRATSSGTVELRFTDR